MKKVNELSFLVQVACAPVMYVIAMLKIIIIIPVVIIGVCNYIINEKSQQLQNGLYLPSGLLFLQGSNI
jgi:hypothetical protein